MIVMWVESVEFMLVPWVNINNHNYNWGSNTLQEFPQSPKKQKGIGKKNAMFLKFTQVRLETNS